MGKVKPRDYVGYSEIVKLNKNKEWVTQFFYFFVDTFYPFIICRVKLRNILLDKVANV